MSSGLKAVIIIVLLIVILKNPVIISQLINGIDHIING